MSIHLELPAWFIDEVILDDLGVSYYSILNRDPEVGESDIRVNTNIAFDLVTDAADTPTSATLQVFISVNGGAEVLALDNGASFQAGFTGPDSAVSFPDTRTLRVVIDPTSDFSSLDVVTVRVAAISTAPQTLAALYSFTVEDVTAPVLLSALARNKTVVRLTFDEPVVMTAPANANSALNPANYAFTRPTAATDPSVTKPSVPIVAVTVEMVTTNEVDITLDWEMTPEVPYTVIVTGVEDLFDNPMEAPTNAQAFEGFLPLRPLARDFNLYRQLPQKNRDEDFDKSLLKFSNVDQEVTDLLLCLIDEWSNIFDPDKAPDAFLDAILCDLGNPFQFDLDANGKRKLIRILVAIYQQKGTAIGIINVVRFFIGIEIEVLAYSEEGWDLGIDELGGPGVGEEGTAILGPGLQFNLYSFEIVSPVALTTTQRDQITDIVELMKPAHTHFIRFVEPVIPIVIDHLELGLSELAPEEWILH